MNKSTPLKHFLRDHVQTALKHYLAIVEDAPVHGLYNLVLAEVEAPLLTMIMHHTAGNQSLAAKYLGINRNTLKKLLIKYEICH